MICCPTRMRPKGSMPNMSPRRYWAGEWQRQASPFCVLNATPIGFGQAELKVFLTLAAKRDLSKQALLLLPILRSLPQLFILFPSCMSPSNSISKQMLTWRYVPFFFTELFRESASSFMWKFALSLSRVVAFGTFAPKGRSKTKLNRRIYKIIAGWYDAIYLEIVNRFDTIWTSVEIADLGFHFNWFLKSLGRARSYSRLGSWRSQLQVQRIQFSSTSCSRKWKIRWKITQNWFLSGNFPFTINRNVF